MSNEKGFIVIQRKIVNWQWWHNNTARGLWIYILTEANWCEGYLADGTLVQRGTLVRSLRKMAEDSGTTVNTIRYWLKRFSATQEITHTTTHGYTVINVVNYDKYQLIPQGYNTVENTHSHTPTDTPTNTVGDTDITIKQINNKESIYSNTTYSHKYQRKNSPLLNMIQEYSNNEEVISALIDFGKMRKMMKKPLTERALKLLLNKLDKLADSDTEKIKVIEQSIQYNWQGFFEVKPQENNYGLGTAAKGNNSKPASWQDEPPTKPEDYVEFQKW